MNRYDVYSLGSALVDLQFTVSFAELEALSSIKGMTYLIDEVMEKKISVMLQQQVPQRFCGGSGANTLAMLQKMGGKGFYSCHVADDAEGEFYYQDLLRSGIASNLDMQPRSSGITGKSIILITPDSERTLHTFLGASAALSCSDIIESALGQSTYLFMEGFLLFASSSKQALAAAYQLAKQHHVKVALTLTTCFLSQDLREALLAIIDDGVDVLFCNEQEAKAFCGTDNINDITQQLRHIAKQFVITRGEQGALLYDGSSICHIDSCPTQVVDTTGAGDAFAGAFLYACCRDYSFQDAGHLATQAASSVISQSGAR